MLAGCLLGWRTVCAVEIDAYCRRVLLARQRDGLLERFPIWDDVRTFDGKPWNGSVDVLTAGFPCQDISTCNREQRGIDGPRSGLWREVARITGEVRPGWLLLENSPNLVGNGLARVIGDLAALGYVSRWGCFRASTVGAAHHRERIYVVAHADGERLESVDVSQSLCADTESARRRQLARAIDAALPADDYARVRGDIDDVAGTMDRLKAIGNGWVPLVAATAWRALK